MLSLSQNVSWSTSESRVRLTPLTSLIPPVLLWIIHVISVMFLLCFCARLFIVSLWSHAEKGLTSWLSFVVSNCEFVTFQ